MVQAGFGRFSSLLALFPLPGGEGQGEGFCRQQSPAHLGKFQIRLTGDDVVSQFHDLLSLGLVADLRAAEDDFDLRPDAPDGGDDLGGLRDVPDVDAEAEDARFARKQRLGDVERTQVDVELRDGGARLQFAEIGEQIAQPERGMTELRVERGEDDFRHRLETSN